MRIVDAESLRPASPARTSWRRLTAADGALVTFLLLSGLWLFGHHYRGLIGDAQLYALQALAQLQPEIFRNDIFLAYGSQDDYTLFGKFYALAISALGLNGASLSVVVLAHTLWALASWRIAKVLPSPQCWVFLAILFTLPRFYATQVFGSGESIATARVVAEALVLAAIAATLAGRYWLGATLSAAALSVHPLMAVWGVFFIVAWHAQHNLRRSAIAGAIMLACAAALLLANGLLPRLLATMDDEWLALVRARSDFVFLSSWRLPDFNLLVVNFCTLAAAWRLCRDPTLRRLFFAALLTGLTALALALIGGSWLHNLLLIQAQPMRGFWLMQWMAILAFATLLGRDAGKNSLLALFLASAWLAQDTIGGIVALAGLLLAAKAYHRRQLPAGAWAMAAVAGATWVALRVAGYALDTELFRDDTSATLAAPVAALTISLLLFLLYDGSAMLGAAAAWALHAIRSDGAKHRWLASWLLPGFALLVFGGSLALAVILADRPQPYFADDGSDELPRPFARLVPPQAVVYWEDGAVHSEDGIRHIWFALGRRSYYSPTQSAGALFSRPATLEMKRRADRLAGIGTLDSRWRRGAEAPPPRSTAATFAGLVELCRDAQLDFVVLKASFPEWQTAEWFEPTTNTAWWLYDCRRLRRDIPPPNAGSSSDEQRHG